MKYIPILGYSNANKNIPEFFTQVNEFISLYGSMLVNKRFPYQNFNIFASQDTIISSFIIIFFIGNRY